MGQDVQGRGFHVDTNRAGVAGIILDNADKHNAFDAGLIADLTACLEGLTADAGIGTIILSAEGKSFSAGANIDWMKSAATKTEQENLDDARALAKLMRTLNFIDKTTIALVQGAAFGGGAGLAACCDIVIATPAARFAFSEVKLGIIPAAISPYVIAAIGERQARRYFQTAEIIDAAEAQRIGLVHEIVDDGGLSARADEIIASLDKGGPKAKAAAKQLVFDVAGRPVDDALAEMTAAAIAGIRASEEAREGLAAFLERRAPGWTGER
jgi:methylglutaconyl-CoA hydratase